MREYHQTEPSARASHTHTPHPSIQPELQRSDSGRPGRYLITFCVPVYDRALLLRRCLASLVSQTLSPHDYEIIVVDDCSTDDSALVAEAVFRESAFPNGHIIRRLTNSGGASVPRNDAIRRAQGDYLFFVDSDDYVASDLAANVTRFAYQNHSDVVYVKYHAIGDGLRPPQRFSAVGNIPQADIIRNGLLYATMVHKAFRRAEWIRLGLTFDPTVTLYEDMLVTVEFLMNTSRHSVLADQDYYFFVNHQDPRLHLSHQSLQQTFDVYSRTLDSITRAPVLNQESRLRFAAVLVNRIMQNGPASQHSYLQRSCAPRQASESIALWRGLFTQHFPKTADKYLNPRIANHVRALRHGSRTACYIVNWAEQLRISHPWAARPLRRLLGCILALTS